MCILFVYSGSDDDAGDYRLILASNRDEYYDRPSQEISPWIEDPTVFGGRDLQPGSGGGTWLAIAPSRSRIGILLNLPGNNIENAQSRGKIVADFVKCEKPTHEYIESIRKYTEQCNGFVLVTAEFGKQISTKPIISTYSNSSSKIINHQGNYLGFGNCLPDNPLKKVEAGINKLKDVCSRLNKVHQKKQLIEELLTLLKSEERHLPDAQLEKRSPMGYKQLSSIFVSIPELRYGTRTHTLILVTKAGHVDVLEVTLQSPIDPLYPKWRTTEHQFTL